MEIKIEPVQSEQANLLAEVSRTTFYDTFCEYNTKENMQLFLEQSFHNKVLEQELAQEDNYFFFAKINDEIAGYVKLSTGKMPELNVDNILEISRIYVVKEKLGLGIGKFLMDFILSLAKQMNKTTLCLGVWEHNRRAISFYEDFGFKKFGEHIFMVGNDPQTDNLMKRAV